MKIILLQDVKSQGKKGDIIDISDGYARNFILPKKLGIEATAKNLNDLKLQKAAQAKLEAEQLAAAQELGKKIEAGKVNLTIKTGEGGRFFGSISAKEIGEAIKDQMGLDIDKKKLVLKNPIKAEGHFTVGVKLHPLVTAELAVWVESEK